MIDFARGCAKPEVRAKPSPKIQPEGKGNRTKQPKGRQRASVPQHVPRIANPAERSNTDVGTVGNEAESRKELNQVRQRDSARLEDHKHGQGQEHTNHWPSPDDQHGVGIGRHVRSGDRQWMKDDSFNRAAGGNGGSDMPKFVNGRHCQPAQRQEGTDQQNLVKAFHVGLPMAALRSQGGLGPCAISVCAAIIPFRPSFLSPRFPDVEGVSAVSPFHLPQ